MCDDEWECVCEVPLYMSVCGVRVTVCRGVWVGVHMWVSVCDCVCAHTHECEVCTWCVCVHKHGPVLPALIFPRSLPPRAVTVADREMS